MKDFKRFKNKEDYTVLISLFLFQICNPKRREEESDIVK
jgi:hypothetical protein